MKAIQATKRQLLRCSLILTWGVFTSHPLYSQSIYSPPYTFTTLAGQVGIQGNADGMGTNAQFHTPFGTAVDSAGNIYVADAYNYTIRKITPGGVVSTLAGQAGVQGTADGTGSNARFCYPYGVAVDSAGYVYVADTYNNNIRKITPEGVVSTLAGRLRYSGAADGTGTNAQFYQPYAVAVDGAGNVFVADYGNSAVRKVTPEGVVTTLAGKAGSRGSADGSGSNAQFYAPTGVAADGAGNVFVADTYNHLVRKITPDGVVTTLAGQAGVSGSADGTGTHALFHNPTGVAVDSAGNVYVTEWADQIIRKITPEGVVTTLAGVAGSRGSANGTGSNAQFSSPFGLAVDSAGNLYVADLANNTIRVGRAAPAPPLLGITPACGQVVLSWPLEASNFLVEASSTLSPAPSWMPLTNAVGTDGNSCVLTNCLETGARFFRLRLP